MPQTFVCRGCAEELQAPLGHPQALRSTLGTRLFAQIIVIALWMQGSFPAANITLRLTLILQFIAQVMYSFEVTKILRERKQKYLFHCS